MMFLKAEAGPVASGRDKAASSATVGYCLAVDPVVKELWRDNEAEIKRRCTRGGAARAAAASAASFRARAVCAQLTRTSPAGGWPRRLCMSVCLYV